MANIPLPGAAIKPTTIVLHYPFLFMPIHRPFCAVELSEYIKWGWSRVEPSNGECIQLTYPNSPFRMVS